jgi:hypothetical protein
MTKALSAAFILVLSFATFAAAATPTPNKAKVHGVALSGRVSRVDRAKLTFAVRDESGREVALSWTAATKITGGELKAGEPVTLRYLDKDSKHIATTIRVGPPAPAKSPAPAVSAPATPSPR